MIKCRKTLKLLIYYLLPSENSWPLSPTWFPCEDILRSVHSSSKLPGPAPPRNHVQFKNAFNLMERPLTFKTSCLFGVIKFPYFQKDKNRKLKNIFTIKLLHTVKMLN